MDRIVKGQKSMETRKIKDRYSKAFVIPILTAIRGKLHVANVIYLARACEG